MVVIFRGQCLALDAGVMKYGDSEAKQEHLFEVLASVVDQETAKAVERISQQGLDEITFVKGRPLEWRINTLGDMELSWDCPNCQKRNQLTLPPGTRLARKSCQHCREIVSITISPKP